MVNLLGQALGLSEGATQVTASLGAVVSNSVTLSVTPVRIVAVAISGVQVPGGIRFTASALLSDGQTTDVTAEVLWSATPDGILSISNTSGSRGFAAALSPGTWSLPKTAQPEFPGNSRSPSGRPENRAGTCRWQSLLHLTTKGAEHTRSAFRRWI